MELLLKRGNYWAIMALVAIKSRDYVVLISFFSLEGLRAKYFAVFDLKVHKLQSNVSEFTYLVR